MWLIASVGRGGRVQGGLNLATPSCIPGLADLFAYAEHVSGAFYKLPRVICRPNRRDP